MAARARGIARAVALLTEPRVLLIGRRTAQADRFSAKFGGVVDVMDLDKFAEVVEGSLFDGRRLFEAAPANHHVFIPGDRREEVRAVAYLLGVGLLEY